jgi:pyrimidine-nucleoside phosphorylase
MYDLIQKKQRGIELNDSDYSFIINGVTDKSIPLEQVAAFLMAVFFVGMTDNEISSMTMHMAHSGSLIDLSAISGYIIDKHSTGGIGDKTTLIVGPIVASCGVNVAKMSGRGLGYTGGTIDKLESIPGFNTKLSIEEFVGIIKDVGICISGQTKNLAPADKQLYALRDTTSTVESIPLIAASIMSKKIASGAHGIVLDVKVGSGAFMKNFDDAVNLGTKMVSIGKHIGKQTVALISNMDSPLGYAIGNALEVQEAIQVLEGSGPDDLKALCVELAANMLFIAGKNSLDDCRLLALEAIETKKALQKFKQMVQAQNGDLSYIENPKSFKAASVIKPVLAAENGYIYSMDSEKFGLASMLLGAGRERYENPIDHSAGLVLSCKLGRYIKKGDVLATMHTNDPQKIEEARMIIEEAYQIKDILPPLAPIVLARVNQNGELSRYN